MKTFKRFLEETVIEEDGVAAVSSAPTNVVTGIAGTGGVAGEPGVSKKRKSPILSGKPLTRKY